MRTSRISRLARLAQARGGANTSTSNAASAQIKAFDVAGASAGARIAGFAALATAGENRRARGGRGERP